MKGFLPCDLFAYPNSYSHSDLIRSYLKGYQFHLIEGHEHDPHPLLFLTLPLAFSNLLFVPGLRIGHFSTFVSALVRALTFLLAVFFWNLVHPFLYFKIRSYVFSETFIIYCLKQDSALCTSHCNAPTKYVDGQCLAALAIYQPVVVEVTSLGYAGVG